MSQAAQRSSENKKASSNPNRLSSLGARRQF
jgi:hypothetical protein